MRIFSVVLVFAIFFAMMYFVKLGVHAVVDLGFVPWLIMMGVIFAVGFMIDRRDCKKREEPPYSAKEYAAEFYEQRWIYAFWGAFLVVTFIGYYGFR